MLARIRRTMSYGACALRAPDASNAKVRPMLRVATTPNSCIKAIMVSTSLTSGTFVQLQPSGAEKRCGDLRGEPRSSHRGPGPSLQCVCRRE